MASTSSLCHSRIPRWTTFSRRPAALCIQDASPAYLIRPRPSTADVCTKKHGDRGFWFNLVPAPPCSPRSEDGQCRRRERRGDGEGRRALQVEEVEQVVGCRVPAGQRRQVPL